VIFFGGYMIWVLGYDKRAISDSRTISILGDATSAEDIFNRNFSARKLRTAYYDRKEYISSHTSPVLADEVAKALSILDKYYNTARAELGLPPIK